MLETVEFLKSPHSYLARQFPVGNMDQYVFYTVPEPVKVTEDIEQAITVPYFDGYSECNMVRFRGSYYWIGSFKVKTLNNPSITFNVGLNPITTYFTQNTEVTGIFEKTPAWIDKKQNFTINTDSFIRYGFEKLPSIATKMNDDQDWFFVQIVSSYNISNKRDGELVKYCFFATRQFDSYSGVPVNYRNPIVENFVYTTMPTIAHAISGIDDVIGIPADTIVDISISTRCPYKYDYVSGADGFTHILFRPNGSRQYANILNIPSHAPVDLQSVAYWMITSLIDVMDAPTENMVVDLFEEVLTIGSVSIYDTRRNLIANINSTKLIDDYSKNLGIRIGITCISDYTGLYTYIYIYDNLEVTDKWSDFIVYPEGKLPWVGDNFQNYMTRGYDSDRQQLNLTTQNAKTQADIDLVDSAVNSVGTSVLSAVATANPLAAITGLFQFVGGLFTRDAKKDLTISNAEQELKIAQARIKNSASNYFNTMYGESYVISSYLPGSDEVRIELPKGYTTTEYRNFIKENGYPCSGLRTFNISDGYIKGLIKNNILTGIKGDLLRTEIYSGARLIFI